jgi:hypothetical protein
MDLTSLLLLAGLAAGLVFVFGGETSRRIGEGFFNALFRVERAIRSFYAKARAASENPAVPTALRLILLIFVRVSWYVWLLVVLLFGVFLVFGKALRSIIRHAI